MRKFAVALIAIVGLSASPALAHCGSCGVGDAHTHAQAAAATEADIVDVAVANGSFTTLVAAVKAADLVDTLKSDGPFTVFAPNDAAFDKLPGGTVENLLADPDKLKEILLYHVVPGKVKAADVVSLSSATTAEGSDVSIEVVDGTVLVDGAEVIATDVMASNGVIHVIDTVLIPSS